MKSSIINNKWFLGLSLMLVIALGLALLCIPKADLHLLLCDRHTPARDIFYRYYTTLAEWFPYLVCVAILLFGRIGDGVMASCCMIGSALTTQLFKHLINAPRPLTWFAEHAPDTTLPLTDGVHMNLWYSFPSGHTTSFFALALVLCLLSSQSSQSSRSSSPRFPRIPSLLVQLLLFMAATLGAYSRIYLSQHFAFDVFAGIVIGIAITLLIYALFTRLEHQKWYNYRLFSKK